MYTAAAGSAHLFGVDDLGVVEVGQQVEQRVDHVDHVVAAVLNEVSNAATASDVIMPAQGSHHHQNMQSANAAL